MNQRVFSKTYVHYLKNNIVVDYYRQGKFPIDEESAGIRSYSYVQQPGNLDELVSKLNTSVDDFQSAKLLYEAYPGLNPLIASEEEFWVYLTHVDFFDYVKKRWPIASDTDKNYVKDHWFLENGFYRTTLCNMWWSIHMSIDEEREDKYELSKILFKLQDFRTRRFGPSTIFRYKEAALGTLQFLKDHEELFSVNFEPKANFITKSLNSLSGSKKLGCLKRDYFRNLLEANLDYIMKLKSRSDVSNVQVSLKLDV